MGDYLPISMFFNEIRVKNRPFSCFDKKGTNLEVTDEKFASRIVFIILPVYYQPRLILAPAIIHKPGCFTAARS